MAEENFSPEQSLKTISEMINKTKTNFHESGASAILWGTATTIAGIVSFAEAYFNFSIGFDIWWIIFLTIIPQIIISIKQNKRKTYSTYSEKAIAAVWITYGISIACYIFYLNVVPDIAGREIIGQNHGAVETVNVSILSQASVLLILYAIPTLATGIICGFRSMLIAGILCYGLFIVSCYTNNTWDLFLLGIAGIINWLIPGLILQRRFLKTKTIKS